MEGKLKKMYINAVGIYTPEMCEIPNDILVNAMKLVPDKIKKNIKNNKN